MSSPTQHGSNAYLRQARRNNWQRYLESLPSATDSRTSGQPPARVTCWDVCVLTASDDTQAAMMRRQLAWRQSQGLLPVQTRFFVVADPSGKRIGSGGATLRILSALYQPEDEHNASSRAADLADIYQTRSPHHRVLVIHSGGDSRRLPHCSAVGKLFARIPHVLPDGRASTIFDEMLINLSGIAASSPPGVLVLSGDVLLVFDHLQLSFHRHGVTGVSVAAPEALGLRHGVYVPTPKHKFVRAFLHKTSTESLRRWQAVDEAGEVQIDTGLVWFDTETATRLASLSSERSISALMDASAAGSGINLYGDLLLPLAEATERQAYLDDESDGPATPDLRAARETIWAKMRGIQFTVERLQPAVFVHFGTSQEYWRMVTSDMDLSHMCGWSRQAGAWINTSDQAQHDDLVLINAILTQQPVTHSHANEKPSFASDASPALITDSHLSSLNWRGQAIVAGLLTQETLDLQSDVILHQLPVDGGYVTRILGMRDDPKRLWDDPRATYLNQPWTEWLADASLAPEHLWSHVPTHQWNLWNARLFPRQDDREDSLLLSLPLQDPAHAPQGWRDRWQSAPRLSLAEGFAQADGKQILDDIAVIEDHIAAQQALEAIRQEKPASEAAQTLRTPEVHALKRRCSMLESRLETEETPVLWRGLSVLSAVTGDSRYEDAAFANLARAIQRDVEERQREAGWSRYTDSISSPNPSVRVESAARIDFGGGWTDTPPYSLERNSYVVNAAVSLRGILPITVEAAWLDQPKLILESKDIDEVFQPQQAGEILDHRNPSDPFALVKAALVLKGIVPVDTSPETELAALLTTLPGGIQLSTQTSIPRGSGLGTSSIMAGAVLTALDELAGIRSDQSQLFDQVLCLEQMMTTGGGWQDQVGGLLGGVKLVTSQPGLPQHLQAKSISTELIAPLSERLFLVYTGQQRLAKNLLRAIMARWIARDSDMVTTLHEIGQLAIQMEAALQVGNIDEFGELIGEHWLHNRHMDPGCTNPFIDDLFTYLTPWIIGGKLAGAGGGGFAIMVARDGVDFNDLDQAIRRRYAGTPVGIWPSDIAVDGLIYSSPIAE